MFETTLTTAFFNSGRDVRAAIGLAPDYSWAVVGDPGRDYLWILARAPRLEAESMATARAAARDNAFDVERLVTTSQASATP